MTTDSVSRELSLLKHQASKYAKRKLGNASFAYPGLFDDLCATYVDGAIEGYALAFKGISEAFSEIKTSVSKEGAERQTTNKKEKVE